MNNTEQFWIFGHIGFGDHIVMNALYRHHADIHKEKTVIIPCWTHNHAAIQWMLSDVPNITFYPIETEQQLLTCMDSIDHKDKLCLGFYHRKRTLFTEFGRSTFLESKDFNPVLWDSEFYRQAGLPASLKWEGFKLPEFFNKNFEPLDDSLFSIDGDKKFRPYIVCHQDGERGFSIKSPAENSVFIDNTLSLQTSVRLLFLADEIHCIDSSMLNLADLMDTPYCKRFVFHKYARKGLPPSLRKPWTILD